MPEIILYIVVFIVSYLGVRYYRFWSLRNELLDIPNERSSHKTPTPRGGGLIIVITTLLAYVVYSKIMGRNFSGSYVLAAFLIAAVSWLDDLLTISFVWRFLIQTIAAIIIVSTLGYFSTVFIPEVGILKLNFFGAFITFCWIVWMTNAFNFMDGIDGLAGIQAVTASLGWMIVGRFFGFDELSLLGSVLAFSSLGFLIQNWFPAKIFMGDVGSAFLGFTFAVLPVVAKSRLTEDNTKSQILPLITVSLIWLFLFDTVLTFFQRIYKKKKIWQAHREHIYQRLVIAGYTHRFVSILYGAAAILPVFFILFVWQQKPVLEIGLIVIMMLQTVCVSSVLYFTKQTSTDLIR